MLDQDSIDAQLKDLNLRFRMFGRAEIKELRKVLSAEEKILHCVYGFYHGGSGLLVATADRLLLLDKRPFFLNVEDLRYEAVKFIDMKMQFLQASLCMKTNRKKLVFKSVSDARLRELKEYISDRINEVSAIEQSFVDLEDTAKPYLNPAWRSRHTILPRRRPQKFYPAHKSDLASS